MGNKQKTYILRTPGLKPIYDTPRSRQRANRQYRAERAVINAEALQVDIHMKSADDGGCNDGEPGKCVLHDWLKGMAPYGWSKNEGGFLDHRTPVPGKVCGSCGANRHKGPCAEGLDMVTEMDALRAEQREARKRNAEVLRARRQGKS